MIKAFYKYFIPEILFLIMLTMVQCKTQPFTTSAAITDTLFTVQTGKGNRLEFYFIKGKEHNHPLMALWIEDTSGNYIQTLYISESIAKGEFKHGDASSGKWMPGPIRRPAALPVWAHSRGIVEEDGLYVPTINTPIADAYTGPTPRNNFILYSKTENKELKVFDIYFEINQSWDWNTFWNNNKYSDDKEYKTSCQPALIYKVRVNLVDTTSVYPLKLTGHSHYSGTTGDIYPDLTTFTTALLIVKDIYIKVYR